MLATLTVLILFVVFWLVLYFTKGWELIIYAWDSFNASSGWS